jgi:pimeloyl-ACP methyl ester carboxylesterase
MLSMTKSSTSPNAQVSSALEEITQLQRTPISHRFLQLEEVRIHYVDAGSGPLVVLLHGFPEFWFTWRLLIPALAEAGFHVVAPDLRGYNSSSKPHGVRAYGIRSLVADVSGLIASLGHERAHVIGHDWGAGIAWSFAMQHPEQLARLAVLNGPHPERLLRGMRNPAQLAKSWYMFYFQLPWLPEALIRKDDYAFLLDALRDEPSRKGAYDARDLARYLESFRQPGALEAMLNYYRAMFRPGTRLPMRTVDAQTLVLWGEQDPHLARELAQPERSLVPNARVEYLPDATHWVQHDSPERVSELLIQFLRG